METTGRVQEYENEKTTKSRSSLRIPRFGIAAIPSLRKGLRLVVTSWAAAPGALGEVRMHLTGFRV